MVILPLVPSCGAPFCCYYIKIILKVIEFLCFVAYKVTDCIGRGLFGRSYSNPKLSKGYITIDLGWPDFFNHRVTAEKNLYRKKIGQKTRFSNFTGGKGICVN